MTPVIPVMGCEGDLDLEAVGWRVWIVLMLAFPSANGFTLLFLYRVFQYYVL